MKIEDALRELRNERKAAGAPPKVEAALLAEFRRVRKPRPAWRNWWTPIVAAAFAAGMVAAFVYRPETRVPAAPVAMTTDPPVETAPVIEAGRIDPAPLTTPRRRARIRPQLQPTPVEVYSAFHPVPGGDPFAPLESGQLVRVQMPRTAMSYFGLPVNPARGEFVKAEVVLGEDGMARAIRFVQDRY